MKLCTAPILASLLAAGAVCAGPVRLEATASPLEGSRFDVRVVPDEKTARRGETAFDESLVFSGGRVLMVECAKAGFEASPYSLTPSASSLLFRAEQECESEGTDLWTAEIRDGVIRGTLTRTRKNGKVAAYTFDGKQVGK